MVGEVQRPRLAQRGHLYFELVEKGQRDAIVGKLDAVLWRTDHARVRQILAKSRQEIVDGVEIRCRCQLDFYPPAGRLQLVVRDVDPLFTLGHLELRRRETLAALAAAGLMERNREQPLPELALRLGLITSEGSAAFHDFLTGLEGSGYGFEVLFHHAAMQGRDAEAEVVGALARLATVDLDAIALVRGGGSRSDLAVFDSRAVATAVACCPWPVLTGLGHEIDQSITDRVSHRAFKTPTEVAVFLASRMERADLALADHEQAVCRLGAERLRRAEERLARISSVARLAGTRLAGARQRWHSNARAVELSSRRSLEAVKNRAQHFASRLADSGPRLVERKEKEPERLCRRMIDLARGRLRERSAVLDGWRRLCLGLDPQRALERGYSVTRKTTGELIRKPEQVRSGDAIVTRLVGGLLPSRVESS